MSTPSVPLAEPIAAEAPVPAPAAAPSAPRAAKARRRPTREGGSIFRRDGSQYWWLKWYDRNGKPHRESTRTAEYEDARTTLLERLAAVRRGEPVTVNPARLTVNALLDDLENDYRAQGQELAAIAPNVARLRNDLGRARAVELTTADLRDYIARHQRSAEHPKGLSGATLNRDMSALRRAYTLARQDSPPKLLYRPHFPMLKESTPRAGFFEREQFEAVRRSLPEAVRPVVTFAYLTGWRVPSEVLTLTWAQVSFEEEAVRLEPGTTKNGDARTFPFTPELRALLEAQHRLTDDLQRRAGRIIPWVFHRQGRPIKDFRAAWATACEKAGVPGRIPHDFRRTAVRNLERAGVSRSVAMKLTGHRTESVYRRYAIVSESDLRAAAGKMAGLFSQHTFGHSGAFRGATAE